MTLVGEIINVGAETISYVEISATLYNSDDQIVAQGGKEIYPLILPPNWHGCFKITMFEQAEWSYVYFSGSYWITGVDYPYIATLNNYSYTDSFGRYHLAGEVHNFGPYTLSGVRVTGVLFTSAGYVVDCGNALVYGMPMEPGRLRPYDVELGPANPQTASSGRTAQAESYLVPRAGRQYTWTSERQEKPE